MQLCREERDDGMSGVLVKGMEFPKNCYDCSFIRASVAGDYYCVAGDGIEEDLKKLYERRMSNCPLVEVKEPHGNLVDLDQMVNDYWDSHSMVIGHKELDEIEVIIEAEGREE